MKHHFGLGSSWLRRMDGWMDGKDGVIWGGKMGTWLPVILVQLWGPRETHFKRPFKRGCDPIKTWWQGPSWKDWHFLKLSRWLYLQMDGWKNFFLGPGLFSVAFAVSLRVSPGIGHTAFMNIAAWNIHLFEQVHGFQPVDGRKSHVSVTGLSLFKEIWVNSTSSHQILYKCQVILGGGFSWKHKFFYFPNTTIKWSRFCILRPNRINLSSFKKNNGYQPAWTWPKNHPQKWELR